MLEFNTVLANKILVTLASQLEDTFSKGSGDEPSPAFYEIRYALEEIDPTIRIYCGATKMAIVTPKLNGVVIKVPFSGWYYATSLWEDDNYSYEERYGFERFCGGGGKNCDDYCFLENEIYNSLIEMDLTDFVAKTEVLGWIGNKCIIVQEEVISEQNNRQFHDYSCESEKASKELQEDFFSTEEFPDDFLALLVDKYGKEKCEQFFEYCEEEEGGAHILEDVHDANYGYRKKDGTPCLLDFCGYNC